MGEPRERAILMSGPMIRAILEGRKTQTRRVVKHGALDVIHKVDGELWRANIYGMQKLHCPFGVPGDRLWVRETWARPEDTEETQACVYRADYDPPRVGDYGLWRRRDRAKEWFEGVWSPSIYMPRWASRITLRVTSIRVERVQAISEEDARARRGWSRREALWRRAGAGKTTRLMGLHCRAPAGLSQRFGTASTASGPAPRGEITRSCGPWGSRLRGGRDG